MASDVLTVVAVAGVEPPHLVGHSLGGAVVTAAGASGTVASVIDIDQSLQLGAFKEQLMGAEAMLRDSEQYALVLDAMFEMMDGELLPAEERRRLDELSRADHDVVLGVWDMLLTQPVEQIEATVDAALAPYGASSVPYLALFGVDPGDNYAEWLARRIPTSTVELWPEHGHYPHLVDPDRFVERAQSFWQ
jgi:pimeloyl-ACP methyl ester carboxylesterase